MELDHTVVLFDEIDELVRERKDSADAFGRFLTTSMLPKLAFLWKIRKVIYFVNTNYLEYFDTAITRDERFDALIFVPPPSFKKKMARICEIINATIEPGTDLSVAITEEEIWGALQSVGVGSSEGQLESSEVLAKFVLIRWSQLHELANLIAESLRVENSRRIDKTVLEVALGKFSDPDLRKTKSYEQFKEDKNRERRDHNRSHVYLLSDDSHSEPDLGRIRERNGCRWLICPPEAWHLGVSRHRIERVDGELATVRVSGGSKEADGTE
jgi:SpoVK/Ycf46/Vps4 family AAA+-type ATPase